MQISKSVLNKVLNHWDNADNNERTEILLNRPLDYKDFRCSMIESICGRLNKLEGINPRT